MSQLSLFPSAPRPDPQGKPVAPAADPAKAPGGTRQRECDWAALRRRRYEFEARDRPQWCLRMFTRLEDMSLFRTLCKSVGLTPRVELGPVGWRVEVRTSTVFLKEQVEPVFAFQRWLLSEHILDTRIEFGMQIAAGRVRPLKWRTRTRAKPPPPTPGSG